jgi:selenocysteine lyase/cysteine desulfurase
MCAPKGAGFLVVADGVAVRPLITSHGASAEYGPANRLHAELDWSGTHDPAANLSVPSAIATVAVEGGGWPAIYRRNHALACELRRRLTDGSGAPPLAPDDALACMAAIPIKLPANTAPLALQHQLLRDGWEVPIVDFVHGPMVRVSGHLYNHAGEAELLAAKLRSLGVSLR